jgi:hypothetical protein
MVIEPRLDQALEPIAVFIIEHAFRPFDHDDCVNQACFVVLRAIPTHLAANELLICAIRPRETRVRGHNHDSDFTAVTTLY